MDLLTIFEASLHHDANVRLSAELKLRKLEGAEGLVPALLQLVSPSATSSVVRLAAAIYLKNRITSSWRIVGSRAPAELTALPHTAIPLSDRQAIKTNILPLLAAVAADGETGIQQQIEATLAKVIECDFPNDWPTLIDEIVILLAGNEGQVEAGLRATCEIERGFRYIKRDPDATCQTAIIAHVFPRMLALAQSIISVSPTTAATFLTQGALLHLITKCFKHSISLTLSELQQESIVAWGSLFIQIAERSLPLDLLPADVDARESHRWVKAQKWSLFSLHRIFSRYGNPSQLPSNFKEPYGPFAERFIGFVPAIMRSYFGIIERCVGGEWLASKCKRHILAFFEECVKPKATWTLLKPHVQELVAQFVFPLICMTPDEIEQFDDDPPEFARSHFGDFVEDQSYSPCANALAFVHALAEGRKVSTLMPTLNFIQEVVSKYPAETTPRQKDGALRMLASLAGPATKNKKVAPMMEAFFQAHVLPEFKSPHGFLRYRACEVVHQFETFDMHWDQRENLETMFRAVMNAITDPSLPVQIAAAIALPEMVRYDEVRAGMVPNIGRIMEELLKMTNQVDIDALTAATRSLVTEFSVEVIPFAVDLSRSLMTTYVRLIQEIVEIRNREGDIDFDEAGEEKTYVCMSLLQTISQLVSSLEKSPESLRQIEAVVAPGLEMTISNNLVELYDEVYEVLDSLTFYQRGISPAIWPIFEASYNSFKVDATDYFNDMFAFFDNIITYGAETLATNPQYRGMLVDMFETVMTSRSLGAEDRCCGCKLAEAMLLNLKGIIDEAIPSIVSIAMTFLLSKNLDDDFVCTPSLYLHSLSLIIAALQYSPAHALHALSSPPPPVEPYTTKFLTIWFKNLSKLTRVHDKKLSLSAVCEVLDWLAKGDGAENTLAGGLLVGALQIFKELPAALNHKAELEKNLLEEEEFDDEEDDAQDLAEDYDETDGQEGDVFDKDNDYAEMLAKAELAGEFDDLDDDAGSTWSEEVLWASPLDQFDAYTRFTACLASLEIINPALFQLAVSPLDAEQRGVLESIGARAMAGGEKPRQVEGAI